MPCAKRDSVIQSLIFGWQSFWKFLSLTPNSYIWKSQQKNSFIAHKFQCLFSIIPNSGCFQDQEVICEFSWPQVPITQILSYWWDSYLILGVSNITQTHMIRHVSSRKDSSTPLGIYWELQSILRKLLPLKFTFHLSIELVCVFLSVCSQYRNFSLLTHSHAPHSSFTTYMFPCVDLIAFLSFVLKLTLRSFAWSLI